MESHWFEKGGKSAIHSEGSRGSGPEFVALDSPSLRRKVGMGTPGCRSAGISKTHLIDGSEIHGGAEGRSAVKSAETRSAGARLQSAAGAGAFIEAKEAES